MVQDPNAQFTSRRRNLAIALGLGVALLGVGMLILFTHGGSSSNTCISQSYVVAAQAIPKGTQFIPATITKDITQASLCTSQVPPTAVQSAADLEGKYSLIDIAQNQTITQSMLAATPASIVAPPPPFTIHKGWVAIAIPNDTQQGVAGFIAPDDHIDILVDTTKTFKFAFQDVHVLYVGTAGQQSGAGGGLLVVELPRAQAEELVFFTNGKLADPNTGAEAPLQPKVIKYALRPKGERGYQAAGDYNPQNSDLNPGHQAVNDPGVTFSVFTQAFGS